MSEGAPSWEACQRMRRECQDSHREDHRAIFNKMDSQHGETLEAIRGISVTVARMNGERAVERESGRLEPVKWTWKEVSAAIAIITAAIGAGIVAVWKVVS